MNRTKLEELYQSIENAMTKAVEADNNDIKEKLYDVLQDVQDELDEMED